MLRLGTSVGIAATAILDLPLSTLKVVRCRASSATPTPVEALPCGSRSRMSTFWPTAAERGAEIDGGGGLAHAAFLVGDGKDAKRGGSGKHASHERGSFLFGPSAPTRTMCAPASVRLGISSLLKTHIFRAASTSLAASRPFRNKPTVRGEDKGAAR